MIYCKSLDKEFKSKEDLFKELKANENKIISVKKAQVYKSCDKGQISMVGTYLRPDMAEKAGFQAKSGFVYPVINTTRYMDSHEDVHFDNLFKRSIKDNEGKIFYVSSHSLKLDDVIAWPEDVRVFTQMVDWNMVGKDYPGQTQALIFEIEESKIKNEAAKDAIKERRKVQGSIRMGYVTVKMGINSNDKEYAVNKVFYDAHINEIANKEVAEELGYFFGIEEAKIHKEGSLVLAGSNDATEIIYSNEIIEGQMTKCPSCSHEFDYNSINESGMGYVKCPNCNGTVMQQIKDHPSNDIDISDPPEGIQKQTIDYEFLNKNFKLKV